MFSAVTFASTVEKENLLTDFQKTENLGCAYTSQYTWYRLVPRQVFSMADGGTTTVYDTVIDRVCTNCYSLGGNATTVTTTCVNY